MVLVLGRVLKIVLSQLSLINEVRKLLLVVYDPFFTVWETLKFQSGYFGVSKNDKWLNEILNNLGLESKKYSNMRSLSGGMKRRVLVAQALVHKPPVIILDEPTAGVDIELRKNIWTFIKKLNSEGHTIVLTTHYLEEAENLCNKIAMLKEGRVVAFDYTRKLLDRIAGIKLLIGVDLKKIKLPNDFSYPYYVENNELIFHLNSPLEVEEILRTFRRQKINIQSVKADSSDLEDVFMKIIKNNDQV